LFFSVLRPGTADRRPDLGCLSTKPVGDICLVNPCHGMSKQASGQLRVIP